MKNEELLTNHRQIAKIKNKINVHLVLLYMCSLLHSQMSVIKYNF